MTYLLLGVAGAIIWDLAKWGMRRFWVGFWHE